MMQAGGRSTNRPSTGGELYPGDFRHPFGDIRQSMARFRGALGAVFASRNGGHFWTRVYQTAHGVDGGMVTYNSASNGWMVFQANNVNLPVAGVHIVERTPNGGRTWTAASVNLISGFNLTGVLPAFDGAHGILTHDHGALRYTPDR